MTSDYELAKMLFPKPRDIVREATAGTPKTSQVRGVATSDSADGSVSVILDTVAGGENAEMTIPTAGGITEGSDVIVTLLDGTPVDTSQSGSLDAANARIDVLPDQIISTVSSTYSTKTETATAKSEAISAAAADATSKANAAQTNATNAAKDYTDGAIADSANTASGSGRSITTTDAAGLPLRDLTVYGESVQEGTPTPDAPVQIQTVVRSDGTIGIGVTHDGTETVTPIDLQGHSLASLPDGTKDVLRVENGRAWIEKVVGVVEMATLGFAKSKDGANTASTNLTSKIGYPSGQLELLMSNEYHRGTNAGKTTNGNMFRAGNWLVITNTACSTTAQFTAALADAVLYYPLATPSTIDLGEVSLPVVQDGDTVRIIAEVQPVIDMSWWRNTAIVEYTAQNETRITQTEADVTTAVTTAQAAQDAVDSISTIIRQYADGVLVCKTGNTVGALVNANGSFDVVSVTWSGTTPTAGNVLASFDEDDIKLAASTQNATIDMLNGAAVIQAITTFLAGADRTSFGIKSNDVALYGDNTIVLQIGDVPESGGTAEICGFSVRKNIGSSVQYLNAPFEPDGTFPMSGAQLTNLIVNWNGVRVFTTGDMHAQNNNDGRAIKYSPDVLFYDENAALGNEPTLNDTLAGYNRARIYAKDNNDYVASVDVVNPDGKYINVSMSYPDTSAYWVNSTIYLLSGTSITISRSGNYELIGNIAQYSNKQIAITRVEAWIE